MVGCNSSVSVRCSRGIPLQFRTNRRQFLLNGLRQRQRHMARHHPSSGNHRDVAALISALVVSRSAKRTDSSGCAGRNGLQIARTTMFRRWRCRLQGTGVVCRPRKTCGWRWFRRVVDGSWTAIRSWPQLPRRANLHALPPECSSPTAPAARRASHPSSHAYQAGRNAVRTTSKMR